MSRYLCGFAIVVFFSALIVGCDEKPPVAPEEPGWVSLGFEDHWAVELGLDWPHLYACAADEGLFRLDLEQTRKQWGYVGLADTSLSDVPFGHYGNRGVQDVAILSDGTLLAGIESGIAHFPGLYRSADDGETWLRSDYGVADSSAPYASTIRALKIIPCEDSTVIAAGNAVYRSEDSGRNWSLVLGRPTWGNYFDDLQVNPTSCGIAWAGGESAIFAGILFTSNDGGNSWETGKLTIADVVDNPVVSIALDPFNSLGVIVCMAGGAIRSEDGGETWQRSAFGWAPDGKLSHVVFDNANEGHFFASRRNKVYETWDGGASADTLRSPDTSSILDLEYDAKRGSLYVGTWTGVFRYNLAVQQ